MTPAEIVASQQDLIAAMERYMLDHGDGRRLSVKEFAARCGVPASVISAVLSGFVRASHVDRSKVERICAVMELPVLQWYTLSGLIKPDDMVCKHGLEEQLEQVRRAISADKQHGAVCPSQAEWATWPVNARLCVAQIYEQLIQRSLMRRAA